MQRWPGLPPQVGVYGYLLGGLGYALLGSSRQLAVGPTSAISLMIAATVGAMAEGDMQRYAQIASLAAFTVAVLCFVSWLLRLSVIALLISDSILVGFKIGAGPDHCHDPASGFASACRAAATISSNESICWPVNSARCRFWFLAIGAIAIVLLLVGEKWLPGRPVALFVVVLAIVCATLLRAAGARRADHRRDTVRAAEPCNAGASHTRCGGNLSAGGGMSCCSPT